MTKTTDLLRYRVRTEWDGLELFDRQEGRVIFGGSTLPGPLFELLKQGGSPQVPPEFVELGLYDGARERWNVEPLIDTPFHKTPAFASAPRRVYWEFTRLCNLSCRACFNRVAVSQPELSNAEILTMARQLYDAGVYEIRCTGGEPTMRADFFEIVEQLAHMGFYLSMGSNGFYSSDTLAKVMASPLDWIILSMDGSDASTHEEIRGTGTFSPTLNSLAQLATKGSRLRINTLIRKHHYTYDHLKGLAELADRFLVESVNCIPLRPVTHDPAALDWQLTPVEFREFIHGLNRLREEHQTDFVTTLDLRQTGGNDRIYFKDRSCAAGREGAVISPYGEMYGCSYSLASNPLVPWTEREKFVAGNLVEKSFLDIWNDSPRWQIYRDLAQYKNETCQQCDYYWQRRCIGNCVIMDKNNPAAFDPYCYLYLNDGINEINENIGG